jgi:hypothetical protein
MFDDPRWSDDPRDRQGDDGDRNRDRDSDRDDEWHLPIHKRDLGDADGRCCDHDHDPRDGNGRDRERDDDTRGLGRGPGSSNRDDHDGDARYQYDARWPERERAGREREIDVRDVFTRHLNLPRGPEREIVRDRAREYTLRGVLRSRRPRRSDL